METGLNAKNVQFSHKKNGKNRAKISELEMAVVQDAQQPERMRMDLLRNADLCARGRKVCFLGGRTGFRGDQIVTSS